MSNIGREQAPAERSEAVVIPVRGRRDVSPQHCGSPRRLDGHLMILLDRHTFEAEQYRASCHHLEEARRPYNLALVKIPPPVPVADSTSPSERVDDFLLGVAVHRTPRSLLAETLDLIAAANVVGQVYYGDDRPFSNCYGSYIPCARTHGAERPEWSGHVAVKRGVQWR